MGANELVIKISGDIESYSEALREAEKQTAGLSDVLNTTATYSAIAFAALSAEIVLATKEFGEAEATSRRLTQALVNQGIYSEKLIGDYQRYADVVSNATGIDDDAIKGAQAVAQAYLGRTKITQELTQAIADLAEGEQISLAAAAEKIGKTIGGTTNAFAKQNLELDGLITTTDRMNAVLGFTNRMYGEAAANANKGVGGIRGLRTAFGDLNEAIGERFAGAATVVIQKLTEIINKVKDNGPLIDFVAQFLAGAAAFALFVAVSAKVIASIIAVQTALTAFGVVLTATRVAIILLAGATGIGLLIVALGTLGAYALTATEKMEQFKNNIPGARKEIKALKDEIDRLEKKAPTLPGGLDAFDKELLKRKKADLLALEKITEEAATKETAILEDKNAKNAAVVIKKEQADKAAQARQLASIEAHNEVLRAKRDGESEEAVAALQKEADLKAQIAQSSNAEQRALLEELYQEQRELTDQKLEEDLAREAEFQALRDEADAALIEQRAGTTQALNQQELAELQSQVLTKQEIARKAAADELKERTISRQRFLEDERKFGVAYATINQIMHSAIYQGSKQAFGELAQLQTSSNATLKGIGKTAAIANIIIKTAESAMNIYNGFSAIPIVGIALGVAGAAAAVAFGAEQIGKVQGAAKGGLAVGGIPGVDSIPFMLQDQELVAPSNSFEEVIGSVRAKREADKLGLAGDGSGGSEQLMMQQLALLTSISEKLDTLQVGQTNIIQGDVLADETYIDTLFEKMSNALLYNNAKLRGVKAEA